MCGRATNVILAPSAGCEGFARRSVTSVPARKVAQSRAKDVNSRIKPTHDMLCRIFVCWLPKAGLLLWIFWASRTEKGPYPYETFRAFWAPAMWLLSAFVASASSWAGSTDPSSPKAWVGRRTRGNSGLCRSYITDSVEERKIFKISVVPNIGSGSKTQRHPQ